MEVLLAEDEPLIRMDIKNMLKEIGCKVVGECRVGGCQNNGLSYQAGHQKRTGAGAEK
ncbi:hypothetical protein SAMN05660649_01000 [Desulfotomaculum arcticum]|uniref:Response regulatory domain-containing protein n=1 Tax=Desulfotruncus arcticus DSM 17038 TaxID=1121424 RepID=A0A1I2Q847_9FIRM|nr:hypothetical protein [Desulfotruncus arcticus]SFG21801.1 hypothetical protein SAMN05660649_01000 [Desulfotomaculum arcticum] [Desulfotruncus arcticus DSM 17038]